MRSNNLITLKDFYSEHYKYPYYDLTSNTVPDPYVKKDRLVFNHKYSLTWRQYRKLCKIYFKYLMEYLLSGLIVILPYYLGEWRFKKARKQRQNKVDFNHFNKTGEIKYFTNRHTLGYIPVFKWKRSPSKARIYTRKIWSWKFVAKSNKKISSYFLEDGNRIHKLIDS